MKYINQKLEEFNKFLNGKKVAIIGMGVSNVPLLDYLFNTNSKVTVFNNKEIAPDIMENINKYNYKVETGDDNLANLKGFDVIFRSPSCRPDTPEIAAEVKNGALLTSEIEMVLKLAPCKIIGVTGTEGKTTTTSIIYKIIEDAGYKCFLGGNIGKPIFTRIGEMTPDDIVALELSSFQLMNMKISPNVSVVTNIYPDHLNVHKSYQEYQDTKKNIFNYQDKNGLVILNNDNEITKNFVKDAKGKYMLFSSLEHIDNGFIYDRNDEKIKFCENGKETVVMSKDEIKLRGIHNYENICAALAATKPFVSLDKQVEAIKKFTGVEHRLEYVRTLNGVKYYNDSIGTSPASTIAGLNAFTENIILLAGGSDKGLDYTKVGEAIAKNVGTLILTGPTSEKIESATIKALEKMDKKMEIFHCKNMKEAVTLASQKAIPNDVVLLSPASASFDAFKNFVERGNTFKELVNNL